MIPLPAEPNLAELLDRFLRLREKASGTRAELERLTAEIHRATCEIRGTRQRMKGERFRQGMKGTFY